VLYELLTGRRPPRADAPDARPARPSAAVLAAPVAGGDAPTPEALARARRTTPARLAARLRGDLDTLLLTALAADPAERYASAEALLADLRRLREGLPMAARPPTLGYRLRKFVRRHRLGVGLGALAVLLVAAFTGALALQQRATARARDRAVAERATAQTVATLLSDLF